MLPDYPKTQKQFADFLNEIFQKKQMESLGIFGQVPRMTIHEGNKMVVERSDGTRQVSQPRQFSASFTLDIKAVYELNLDKVIESFSTTATAMATQISKHGFKTLSREIEKVGNRLDAKGKRPREAVLDALEKIELDFDSDGNPIFCSLVANEETIRLIMDDPITEADEKRFVEIIEKKRRGWLDRESSRKLVG